MSERKTFRGIEMPSDHRFGEGWICGQLDFGEPVFSNVHFALVGEPPKGHKRSARAPCFQKIINEQISNAWVRPVVTPERKRRTLNFRGKKTRLVDFSDGVTVQERYYLAILKSYPSAIFIHGPRKQDAVLAFHDADFVGMIMPITA